MGVCGNVCCVAAIVKNSLGVLKYVVDLMDVISVCIVRRGAVGARVCCCYVGKKALLQCLQLLR